MLKSSSFIPAVTLSQEEIFFTWKEKAGKEQAVSDFNGSCARDQHTAHTCFSIGDKHVMPPRDHF